MSTKGDQTAPPKPLQKLNLGCGFNKIDGFINVDYADECGPDQCVDLEQFPWPWEDNSVESINMSHTLEHLGRIPEVFLKIMCELYRVCAPEAKIEIVVPHHRHDNFHSDPTHVRAITPLGLSLFDRQKCEEWVEQGYSNTPLAIYCDVDLVTEEVIRELDPEWAKAVQDDEISQDALNFHARHGNNVISQLKFTLRVRKPSDES